MDFNDWLDQTKISKPELNEFIIKVEPMFSDSGFNGTELERRLTNGLKQIDAEFINPTNPS
jgi:hypothetical protein